MWGQRFWSDKKEQGGGTGMSINAAVRRKKVAYQHREYLRLKGSVRGAIKAKNEEWVELGDQASLQQLQTGPR